MNHFKPALKQSLLTLLILVGGGISSAHAAAGNEPMVCLTQLGVPAGVTICAVQFKKLQTTPDFFYLQSANGMKKFYKVVQGKMSSCGPAYDGNFCDTYSLTLQGEQPGDTLLLSGEMRSSYDSAAIAMDAKSSTLTFKSYEEVGASEIYDFQSLVDRATRLRRGLGQ